MPGPRGSHGREACLAPTNSVTTARASLPRSRRLLRPRGSSRSDLSRRRGRSAAGSQLRASAPAPAPDRGSTATSSRTLRRTRGLPQAYSQRRVRGMRPRDDSPETLRRRPPRSGTCFTTLPRRSRARDGRGSPRAKAARRRALCPRSREPWGLPPTARSRSLSSLCPAEPPPRRPRRRNSRRRRPGARRRRPAHARGQL
jgi:hypothetical protein